MLERLRSSLPIAICPTRSSTEEQRAVIIIVGAGYPVRLPIHVTPQNGEAKVEAK